VLDLEELYREIMEWLDSKSFESKVLRQDGTIRISGNWPGTGMFQAAGTVANAFRGNPMKVDSALHVAIRHFEGGTQVLVKQGTWSDNAVGNLAWTFVTGGLNVALSEYGKTVITDLEGYVDELLAGHPGHSGKCVSICQTPSVIAGSGISPRESSAFKTIKCPHCGGDFRVVPAMVGGPAKCGLCGGVFNVRVSQTPS
jgi:predicted Zn finger-like uncharacterized protein